MARPKKIFEFKTDSFPGLFSPFAVSDDYAVFADLFYCNDKIDRLGVEIYERSTKNVKKISLPKEYVNALFINGDDFLVATKPSESRGCYGNSLKRVDLKTGKIKNLLFSSRRHPRKNILDDNKFSVRRIIRLDSETLLLCAESSPQEGCEQIDSFFTLNTKTDEIRALSDLPEKTIKTYCPLTLQFAFNSYTRNSLLLFNTIGGNIFGVRVPFAGKMPNALSRKLHIERGKNHLVFKSGPVSSLGGGYLFAATSQSSDSAPNICLFNKHGCHVLHVAYSELIPKELKNAGQLFIESEACVMKGGVFIFFDFHVNGRPRDKVVLAYFSRSDIEKSFEKLRKFNSRNPNLNSF
jgi:hypothetical protein